jgi:integrase
MATFLQFLKETGMRKGEAWRLKWKDVDMEHCIVTLNTPEKNGLPRQFKISLKLIAMLNSLPKVNDKIWNGNIHSWTSNFVGQRNRIAKKLQNPRIKDIHFHTLRHFYAAMLYHKTLSLLQVQKNLGHKSITNTVIYTHLLNFDSDEYTHQVAKTIQEAGLLVDSGFDFVCDYGSEGKLFRKRK